MNKKLKLKIHESLSAVIPITLIVLALGINNRRCKKESH